MAESQHLGGFSKAKGSRNGSRRVTYTESIVLAFRALEETADAVLHPVLAESVASAGYDLVSIGLMSHVKDKLIIRRIIFIKPRAAETEVEE